METIETNYIEEKSKKKFEIKIKLGGGLIYGQIKLSHTK